MVVGDTWGKVKAMFSDVGKRVRKAEPSTPVEVLGLQGPLIIYTTPAFLHQLHGSSQWTYLRVSV
jgi:hypothetical protein